MDRIQSDVARDVSWYWQLGDGELQTSEGQNQFHVHNDRGVSLKIWSGDENCALQLHAGDDDSPVGWHATDYGVARSGQRLRVRLQCEGSLVLTTFVGRTNSPIALQRVSVGRHRIECVKRKSGVNGNKGFTPEIEWTIADNDVNRTYVAGVPPATMEHLNNVDPLSGSGDWSVFLTQEKTNSAAPSNEKDVSRGINCE
jgi:hypothetical protein